MNAYKLRHISNTNVIDSCVHICQIQKLTTFLLSKMKNTDMSKSRANSEKPMSFSDSATSKYAKTDKIFLALEKFFFVDQGYRILLAKLNHFGVREVADV